eukprot:TRINITY_DN4915_c0_g1_i1.p4 TRINITY_DN4915_c0_g1~~TRINITY_DN4915_c0_g1_i1.p4  ORF type:complete len:166 (-),score=24.19 TRINITY_DN4915_c0_g1_i1:195-692(-)
MGAPWPLQMWRAAIWRRSPTRLSATCTGGPIAPLGATTRMWRCRRRGGVLEASSGHLVYVVSGSAGGNDGSRLVPAGEITPGMHLVTADGAPDRVVAVAGVVRAGRYAPHTLHGDLVVAGFRVSSYTTAVHPVVAHALLAPVRAAYAVGWDLLGGWLDEGAPWAA